VTDEGLKELAELKELRSLSLSGTRVTDAGLKGLKGLRQLRLVLLHKTRVTPEGVADFRQALPKCKAYH